MVFYLTSVWGLVTSKDVLKTRWTHFAGLAGARDPFRASLFHTVLTWPSWVRHRRRGAEGGPRVPNCSGNSSLQSIGCKKENKVALFLSGAPVPCWARRSGVAAGGEFSPPLLSRGPRGEFGEKRRCKLFLVALSMTPFKPSGFTSAGVCWADGHGSDGRVGPGAGVGGWLRL